MRKKNTNQKEIHLIAIGNSQGIRLPKPIIQKYHFTGELLLEEKPTGILIKNKKEKKLSWEETYQEMAQAKESWKDLEDASLGDFDLE